MLRVQYVRLYLSDLQSCGLAAVASSIHVAFTASDDPGSSALLTNATALATVLLPYAPNKLHVHTNVVNAWEYPGVLQAWLAGQDAPSPSHYVLYFHAKGITHHKPEPQLFRAVVGNYARVVEVFRGHGYVNKVGLLASEAGFYWFNFWWARGSYLAAVPKPLRHTRAGAEVERHYYMGWVGYQVP